MESSSQSTNTDPNSKQKNKKKIQKNNKIQKRNQVRKIPNYSYIIIQEIPQFYQYHLFGDFYIDLDQLRNLDVIQVIQPISFFKKTISVVENKKNRIVEVTMNSDTQGLKQFRHVIQMIKTMQNKDLVFLIDQLEYYQDLIISKCLQQQEEDDKNISQGFNHPSNYQNEIPLANNDTVSNQNWSFDKSLNFAQKTIDELSEKCKDTSEFFVYCIYRGSKYEQNLEIIGYPKMVLKEFLCLNEEQISYILMRRPFITPRILQDKYLKMFFSKTEAFKSQFSDHKNIIFAQNQSPIKFKDNDQFDLLTVDNILVSLEVEHYVQNLSNYQDMCSDMLFIMKYKPLGSFKAEDIIRSQRYFKKNIVQKSSNSNEENGINQELNFFDLVYRANSELFVEKFYNIMDSDQFHELNYFLS